MKKGIIFLFIVFSLYSCKNKSDDILSLFNDKYKEIHQIQSIPCDSFIISQDGDMLLSGDRIVMLDPNSQFHFILFDKKNARFIKRFVPKGNGPEEFLYIKNFQVKDDSTLLLFEPFKKKMTEYTFNNDKNTEYDYSLKAVEWTEADPLYAIKTENYFVLTNCQEEGFFSLCDKNGKKIGAFFSYPAKNAQESSYDNVYKAFAYQGGVLSRPQSDQFVYFSYNAPIVQFYHAKNDSIVKIKEHLFRYVDYKIDGETSAMNAQAPFGFLTGYATRRYVYLPYSGKSTKEKGSSASTGEKILVFDWEGNPVSCIQLDIPIRGICVDENDKQMWAIGFDPDPVLITFSLE